MKKVLLTLIGSTVVSTAAFAGSLEYDFRGDWQSIDYNDAAALPDFSRFYLKTGRVHYKGNLNDRVSFSLRLGFYKPSVDTVSTTTGRPANASRDNLNSAVEFANVTDKMSDNFSLTLGKFYTEIGGFETASSSADLYMVTPNYSHSAVKGLVGQNIGTNEAGVRNIQYMTGGKGLFTFAETQNIYLVAVNNVGSDPTDGQNFNQNRGMWGMTYRGGFADKTMTGVLSYHEVSPQSATGDSGNKHTFISAGLKYDSDWFASLDYLTTTYKDGVSGNKDILWSGLGKVGYKFEHWAPHLEVFSSEEKTEIVTATNPTPGTSKFAGYGAVAEYRPTAENFRYHIAYNMITTKPPTGDDQTRTEIVLGARILGDFLK